MLTGSTNYLSKMSTGGRQVGKITVSRMKPITSRSQSELSGKNQPLAITYMVVLFLFHGQRPPTTLFIDRVGYVLMDFCETFPLDWPCCLEFCCAVLIFLRYLVSLIGGMQKCKNCP